MNRKKRKAAGVRPRKIAPVPALVAVSARADTEGDSPEQEALPALDEAAEKLAQFFESNPYSTVDRPEGEPTQLQITKPWGDSSLAVIIASGFDALASILNEIVLPERFSAIWHRDLRKLEVIWTALRLPKSQQEIYGRKFDFEHKGRKHLCEFGVSSDRLITLARHTEPQTISETMHRNTLSFRLLANAGEEERPYLDQPRSFWISNVDWDEDRLLDMIGHLNFFMRYFDGLSPTIIVHAPLGEPMTPKRTRYIRGRFPTEITSRELDENLLSFWSFADDGNPMLRFLLYYRIIEYAAVHFIDDSIRDELRKLILSPDLKSDLSHSVEAMVGAMSGTKLSDAQRLQALMRQVVSTSLLWRDIKANIAFFSKDTNFEGGFSIKAVVSSNDTETTFKSRGAENVADAFRKIRNALSHGKDQESAGVIRPTKGNFELFRPWVHLIATAAGEVVLYKDAT